MASGVVRGRIKDVVIRVRLVQRVPLVLKHGAILVVSLGDILLLDRVEHGRVFLEPKLRHTAVALLSIGADSLGGLGASAQIFRLATRCWIRLIWLEKVLLGLKL